MKRMGLTAVLAAGLVLAGYATASANGLQIEPVLLELNAPAAAAVLKLRNDEPFDVSVQTRVFNWSQVSGADHLEPASDVAASPPIVTLAPGADYTVRVVRTATTPVRGEESYRLWIDQLPDSHRQNASGINMLIRQSIPVFFRARLLAPGPVSWSVTRTSDRLLVTASNAGDERVRVSSLRLRDAADRSATFGSGLAGYVLGHSTMTFTILNPPRGFGGGGAVTVEAQSYKGPIHATAPLQSSP